MNFALFGRFFLEFAMMYPAEYLCLASLQEHLRAPRKTYAIGASAITLMGLAGAAVCCMLEQLQTQPEFLVCNRGVIINMSKVLRFEGDCIEMLDGTHLPVRQKDKNSLLAQFTQYQFRGMQREF